jgi:glutaredoxin 3
MASAKVKAQTLIDENGAIIFSKSFCPYCKATKSLLNETGANFKVLELDQIGMSLNPRALQTTDMALSLLL